VDPSRPLTLQPALPAKEKRLDALLAERRVAEEDLRRCVTAAQIAGSLALSGIEVDAGEVEVGLLGGALAAPVSAALTAYQAIPSGAALSLENLLVWQGAFTGGAGSLRQTPRVRSEGPPPAPPEWIEARVRALLEWLAAASAEELTPGQRGALALARLIEILPFEDGNGRVARLITSHLMTQGGARPPILLGSDDMRLRAALQAAFRIDTAPLVLLLREASERALDVMLAVARAQPPR
jgi:hypothetical protein